MTTSEPADFNVPSPTDLQRSFLRKDTSCEKHVQNFMLVSQSRSAQRVSSSRKMLCTAQRTASKVQQVRLPQSVHSSQRLVSDSSCEFMQTCGWVAHTTTRQEVAIRMCHLCRIGNFAKCTNQPMHSYRLRHKIGNTVGC